MEPLSHCMHSFNNYFCCFCVVFYTAEIYVMENKNPVAHVCNLKLKKKHLHHRTD